MAQAAAGAAEMPQGARNDWLVPVAMVALVFVMLVPVPAFVLDLLLATSITLAVIVLLSALVHSAAGAVFGVSDPAAVPDAVSDFAEYREQPADPAARERGSGRRGARDRGVRAVRRGRQLRSGIRDLSGA